MKKETVLLVVVCLVVGVLSGIIFTNAKKDKAGSEEFSAVASSIENQQQIATLVKFVKKDPNNRNAWVQLGNNYFDTNQPMKAIEAYSKALELNGNDANVLTDLGVMYRRVGWYEKAVNSFAKANQIDPQHATSLFNLGIVYLNDLNNKAKAKEAWEKYLVISPVGKGADSVRTMLSEL